MGHWGQIGIQSKMDYQAELFYLTKIGYQAKINNQAKREHWVKIDWETKIGYWEEKAVIQIFTNWTKLAIKPKL